VRDMGAFPAVALRECMGHRDVGNEALREPIASPRCRELKFTHNAGSGTVLARCSVANPPLSFLADPLRGPKGHRDVGIVNTHTCQAG